VDKVLGLGGTPKAPVVAEVSTNGEDAPAETDETSEAPAVEEATTS